MPALGHSAIAIDTSQIPEHVRLLAALLTGPAGALLGVAAGIAGVTAAAVGATEAMRDGGPAVRELTEAAREMNAAMEEAGEAYEDTAASTIAAADVANFYIDKLEEMGDAAQLSDEEQRRYQNTLALLLQVMPSLADCISQTTDEYGRATYTLETTTEALRANTEEWKRNAKAQAYQEYLNSLMEQYNGVMLEAAENEIGLTKARYELEAANKKYNAAIERMNELWAEASAEADRQYREYGILGDATGYLSQEYYDLQNSLADLNQEVFPNRVSQQLAEDYGAYSRYTAAQGVQSARPPLEVTGTASTAAGRPKLDMHFHIEAGASPETVNAWQDYASRGELKAVVLEVLEDADADMRRRAMV